VKIRTKTILLVGIVVLVLGSIGYGVNGFLARKAAGDTERAEVTSSLARATAALKSRVESLESVAGDWAPWDDTYLFVKDHDQAYIDDNLADSALQTLRVDFMVFTDSDGRIVYSKALDPRTAKPAPLPSGLSLYLRSNPTILHQTHPTDTIAGIVNVSGGPVAIAARPIVTSDMKSPIAGTFLTGFFVTQPRLQDISKLTLAPLKVRPVGSVGVDTVADLARERLLRGESVVVTPQDSRTVDGFTLFSGIDGRPALLLQVTVPRTAMQLGERGASNSGMAIMVLFAGLLGALGVAIDMSVLRPLRSLGADVKRVGSAAKPGGRVSVVGNDEIAIVARSVNSTLERLEESTFLATHDALTGLFNRQYFEEAMERDLAETTRLGGSGSVLWLDLDHFKEINDSLGHRVGDELLTQLGELLLNETRSYGIVARLGGDEFGVLLPHADAAESAAVAQRLLTALAARVFEINTHHLRASASMGVVTYPAQGERVDEILARADLAMYAAKDSGRNSLSIYSDEGDLQGLMASRIQGAQQVLRAVQEGGLVLHAQPTVRIEDGSAGPCELLVRMVAEDGSLIYPDDFIPLAEHLGVIRDVDRWVVRKAIAMLAEETAAGRETTFCINLSGLAFCDHDLPAIVRAEFASTGASPSNLVFEITETAAIRDIHKARKFMEELRGLGCRFSLDDFGTGMSSFYYLKQLPLDFLKIDGSLITNLGTTESDAYFVRAIIEMCRGLGIPTVAEYVESAGLLDIVGRMGVDYAQGFHVARPAPWAPEPSDEARQRR